MKYFTRQKSKKYTQTKKYAQKTKKYKKMKRKGG